MSTSILIIDDNDSMRDTIATRLDLENYTVYTASNGIEGIEKIQEYLPDIVICDIAMPDMDGYQVLSEVRSLPGLSQIPFLFLTARVSPDDIRKGMSLGADDYLTKPFQHVDLLTAINVRLENKRKIGQSILESYARLMIAGNDRMKHDVATILLNEIISPLHNLHRSLNDLAENDLDSAILTLLQHVEQVRASLIPDELIYLGTSAMVQHLVNLYESRNDFSISLKLHHADNALPESIQRHLFAILDELLSNIEKYANASQVMLQLSVVDNQLMATVSDDGIGFDADNFWQQMQTIGLMTIRERVRMCGGQFNITSDVDAGTTVNFSLTFNNAPVNQRQNIVATHLPGIQARSSRLLKVVIAHHDALIQRGLLQFISAEKDMLVIARCETEKSLKHIIDDGLNADVFVISVPLLKSVLQHPAYLKHQSSGWIAIGTDEQALDIREIEYVQGYLFQKQVVSRLISGIRSVAAGDLFIIAEAQSTETEKSSPLDLLTRRERQVLEYIANNYQNAGIAKELVISIRTVETHRANMMNKLNLKSKSELVVFALKHGIINLDN